MSAFIVEDETINTVINYLHLKESGDDAYWPRRVLREAEIDLSSITARKVLAQAMLDLNIQAVNELYGRKMNGDRLLITYWQNHPQNVYQVYKSLKCWLYQCAEGSVPETDLFKLMDNMAKAIAMYIVETSPAFTVADWN
jgi:hypothetical protein